MARADLLVSLARAASTGDRKLVKTVLEAIVTEERAKQHNVLAERLAAFIPRDEPADRAFAFRNGNSVQSLFYELEPRVRLSDLVLSDDVVAACGELIEEQHRGDLLRSHGLEPRHRVLLAGPPGTGKTSLAEALAESLMLPMIVVRYEGAIGSFLGETAGRLRRLFDFVRTRQCVLFFDEFETLGKERGDLHDTGEIKRVVSALLLQIDDLPSHVVVITATNHPELLDRAVWRRFQLCLPLPLPTRRQVQQWLERLRERLELRLGLSPRTIADKLIGISFAELEDLSLSVARRLVLAGPEADSKAIIREQIAQWRGRYRVHNKP